MSARSRKVKLPKVWVTASDLTGLQVYASKPANAEMRGFHLYAPVTKPRVCVWTEKTYGIDYTGCGCEVEMGGDYKFCPYCGRKVRVKQ